MRKLLSLLVLTFVCTLLVACNNSEESTSAESKDNIVLRYGFAAPAADPGGLVADKIANDINVETDGAMTIELFPGSQLGGEVEMVEQVRAGTVDVAFVTGGAVSNFVKDISVLDMPFLFDDLDHAHRVLTGEVGELFKEKAEAEGIKILTYMDYGIGNIANVKKDVKSVEDLKGMKMRTLENDIFIDTFKALGTNPVPIPFPELYTSMQQGVVDGTDPVNVTMTGGKLYEVTKHLSKVGLNYRVGILVMNLNKYNELDEDIQSKLNDVISNSTDYYHETIYPEYEAGAEKLMKDNGVKIIEKEDIDIEKFKKAVEPVYEKHEAQFGDIISKIKAEAK